MRSSAIQTISSERTFLFNVGTPAPDAYFFWAIRRYTQFKLDLNRFPNIAAYYARMQARDSVKRLMEFQKETIEEFKRAV